MIKVNSIVINDGATLDQLFQQIRSDQVLMILNGTRIIFYDKEKHKRLTKSKIDPYKHGLSILYDGLNKYTVKNDQLPLIINRRISPGDERKQEVIFGNITYEISRREHVTDLYENNQ